MSRISLTHRLFVLALVALLGASRTTGAEPAADDDLAGGLERAFARETLGEFWGSICVTRDGEVVWSIGVGYADASMAEITPEDALFDVGSIAKSFTAVALLRLADEGKATLGTTLGEVFGGVPANKAGITLEQLLSHTSGVPARFGMERSDTMQGMLDSMWDDPQVSAPGERFAYSNANYFIAAAAVQQLAGEPFEDAMGRLVFEPTGLTRAGLLAPASARPHAGTPTARRANPRGGASGAGRLYRYPWNWGQRGATGVVASARDLCRWADLLASGDLLSEAAREAMLTPGQGGYALGWFVETGDDGPSRFSHNGSTGGYSAALLHDVGARTSVAVLSHNQADTAGLAARLMDLAVPPPPKPTVATVYLAAYPDEADGVYELDEGLAWRVMPEYRGGGVTDRRPTLVLTDAPNRFWPVIIRMDRDRARDLASAVRDAIESVADHEDAKNAPWRGGITLTLEIGDRTLGETSVLALGDDASVTARAEGVGVVLELTEGGRDTPVAAVRMGGAEATQLITGLNDISR